MVHLITPHYQRRRFFRPRRRVSFGTAWRVVRRYQLLELVLLTGGIAAVWLGAYWDNRQGPWNLPESPGVESASTDLIVGVPLTGRQDHHRPL